MSSKIWLCGIFFLLVASGCSNNDMLIKKQMEIDARLEQLIQANTGTNARLNEISAELQELQSRVKGNSADLEELKPELRALRTSMETASPRAGGTPPAATSRIVMVHNKGASPAENDAAEQEAYVKAFGLFSTNNYPAAIEAFQSFITSFPTSEYAVNAQYWIGECFYTERDYSKAIDAFNKVVDQYPNGKKVPDALLKVGFSLISLNQPEKARAALERLVEKYPKSPAAMKARERLGRN